MPVSESALAKKLSAALASRNDRYRFPESSLSLAPSTPRAISDVIITAAATTSNPTPQPHVDFASNDFLSLSTSPHLRARVLAALHSAPSILGSGSSRLLVYNHAHAMLEARLARTFRSPAALLFNSGFDANTGFFSCIPQPGDAVVHDAAIHASVHDGLRSSRVPPSMCRSFAHNDVDALSATLRALRDEHAALREGTSSVIVAVESVYSMNGSVAPLRAMLDTIDEVFPAGNAHMVVDEAHGTGVFGPGGRGLVALLGVEDRVLARLHTFGKALAASGAVILSSTLIRDYLFNYARSLTYTTALSNTAVVSASCSFDLLEDGTTERLAAQVLGHSAYFQEHLRASLAAWSIPLHILALPVYLKQHPSIAQPLTPIVPLLTPRSQDLALHLRAHRFNVRSLSFPIVQKGTDRVRVCLHASNTRAEIDALVNACMAWAAGIVLEERAGPEADGARIGGSVSGMRPDGRNLLGSKL